MSDMTEAEATRFLNQMFGCVVAVIAAALVVTGFVLGRLTA